jgi:hypothetical protein
MRSLVVNCSHPHYNLGASKLANYLAAQGDEVSTTGSDSAMLALGYDRVCLSVIFSWHVDRAIDIASAVKEHAEIWVGGPALNQNHERFTAETGVEVPFIWRTVNGKQTKVHGAPDARFDRQPGEYRMIYAMRGCPLGCSFCPVTLIEGAEFALNRAFYPAKMLCDNNLSAAPIEYQDFVIRRYQETGVPLMDANSGFEPKTFDEECFARWSPILRGAWRFGLDETKETDDVERMMRILKDVAPRKKRVYCLLGLEPIEQCFKRARKVIAWGGEPFCQVFIPLNYPHDPEKFPPPPRHDWPNRRAPYDMRRYFNSPQVWRTTPIEEYKPRLNEPAPFRNLGRAA